MSQQQNQEPLVEPLDEQLPLEHWGHRIADNLDDISCTLKWILGIYFLAIIANAVAALVSMQR